MIIGKSDVRMWKQNVTHTRLEHTIQRDGLPAGKVSEESVAVSPVTANFETEKAAPETFASVRTLLAQIDRAAAQKNSESGEWLVVKMKLLLAWLLLLRLFGLEDEDGKKQAANAAVTPAGDGMRKGGAAMPAPTQVARGAVSGGETAREIRENLFFEAHGKVITGDGEEIPVDIRLKLSDERREITGLSKDAARALIDPLVVNFENESVALSDRKFSFDLDIDGVPENIVMPAEGSAFLALDRNGDGIIGDGSELFGVTSGDGFKDLAAFDDDKNGFIDEGDKIYDKLCLFTRSPDGKDLIFTLREKGVKAISLENLATSLRLRGGDAQLRKTGFIIRENKTASTIQHVDLRPEPLVPAQNSVRPLQNMYQV